MNIAITVGHSKLRNGNYTSASGLKIEYVYCKEQGQALKEILEKEGHNVTLIICPEGQFNKPIEEKGYKLGKVNGKKYDLLIELHLNASNGRGLGTEVLVHPNSSAKSYAGRVVKKLATKFKNRGVKNRSDLYILRDTDCPAILIESFFCDNKEDCKIADELGVKGIAKLIAEGILNKDIVEPKPIIKEEIKQDDVYYRVISGSYSDLDNAKEQMEELKKQGIDTFVAAYKK